VVICVICQMPTIELKCRKHFVSWLNAIGRPPMETMTTIEITVPPAADADVNADTLAASLAEAAPSAGALDELECERLSPVGLIDAVVAWEKLLRHAQAGLISVLGALVRGAGNERWLVESELCAALAWSPNTAQNRLAD